mmetsp:Transcript_2954/g.5626  ORF Transcript_2954/g.5626 Transcript_2954/m.5626 type:complete len:122 (-) Transcript_2954:3399-3764(-)
MTQVTLPLQRIPDGDISLTQTSPSARSRKNLHGWKVEFPPMSGDPWGEAFEDARWAPDLSCGRPHNRLDDVSSTAAVAYEGTARSSADSFDKSEFLGPFRQRRRLVAELQLAAALIERPQC